VAGRSREEAKTDICQAIADRTIKIQVKLRKHTTRSVTSKRVLEGKNFEIPAAIKLADLDWESSRPVKPWPVHREIFGFPGHWHLDWIEVCRADVTKVLCVPNRRDESTRHSSSETSATSTSSLALESQAMPVGSGPRSTAVPRKSGATGPGRRRGRRPEKFEQTKDAIRNDIQQERLTVAELDDMLEKNLVTKYGVSRETARKARNAVLSELNSRQIPTNDK
jgi:hypothetical protein